MEPVNIVQKAATITDIVSDHINGLSGYQIAEKYGMDSERVKDIIREADERGAFVPSGEVEKPTEEAVQPIEEGVNPEPKVEKSK